MRTSTGILLLDIEKDFDSVWHNIFNKSHKRDPTIELSLGNTILPIKPVAKYLGIMLDSKLLFKQHIAMICDKAVKLEELLFPFSTGNQYLFIRIKCCYIRLIFALSYGCQIFRKCAQIDL